MKTLFQRGKMKAELEDAKRESVAAAAALTTAAMASRRALDADAHRRLVALGKAALNLRHSWEWWRVRPLSRDPNDHKTDAAPLASPQLSIDLSDD